MWIFRFWSIAVLAVLIQSRLGSGRALAPVAGTARYEKRTVQKNGSNLEVTERDSVSKVKQPDYFSNNTLEALFRDNRVTARIDSAVLDGMMLSMSGVVTYNQVTSHSNITDEADMAGKSGSSALILQAKLDGETIRLMWMKRSCPCSSDARFVIASANEGDEVWVAGSTTGLENGEGQGLEPGMALMRYNSSGTQLLLRQLGGVGEKYDWVGHISKEKNGNRNITLVGSVNENRYEGMQSALVAETVNESGDILNSVRISEGENVVSETFWNAENMDGTLYVVGKRSVQTGLTPTSTLTLTKLDTESMQVERARQLDNELQRAIVLCTDSEGVTASYVSRNNNQGHVIVEEMDNQLVKKNRSKVKIQRDAQYQKAMRSAMAGCDTTNNPPVLLMNTAEALNQSAPGWEEKRQLNNQRPALLTVMNGTFLSISQSQRSTEWLASGMVGRSGSSHWLIFGKTGVGKPLLASGMVLEAEQRVTLPSPSPNVTTTGAECIGEQTTISGMSVTDIIRANAQMRRQRHPLRLRAMVADTLCRRIGADLLCATAQHVVRVRDETMFMHEWCARTGDCEQSRQRVLNFKAPCGVTLPATEDGARLTMHSGHATHAHIVERAECRLQSRSIAHRAWWWLNTL